MLVEHGPSSASLEALEDASCDPSRFEVLIGVYASCGMNTYLPLMCAQPCYANRFTRDANGTVLGLGTGVVVLRRLEDALRDRDTIRAVILGTAGFLER